MEFLGYSSDDITISSSHKYCRPINLYYENVEQFCEATSKIIRGFVDDCKLVVSNKYEQRHIVEVLDYRYNSTENLLTIYPESCKKITDSKKNKKYNN